MTNTFCERKKLPGCVYNTLIVYTSYYYLPKFDVFALENLIFDKYFMKLTDVDCVTGDL